MPELYDKLYRHIGNNTDVPAGDIGVGERKLDSSMDNTSVWLIHFVVFLQARVYHTEDPCELKPLATAVYLIDEMLRQHGNSLESKTVVISGSGNVAIYAAKSATLRWKSGGFIRFGWIIYDAKGVDIGIVKEIKELKRSRIAEYTSFRSKSVYTQGRGIWNIKCDIALPCATQNELDQSDAKELIKNGCFVVGEGANMPTTLEATQLFLQNKVLFVPGKAANAGGVAVSALEMSQNSMRTAWTFDEVDHKLKEIMKKIYNNIADVAKEVGQEDNFVVGANIAGFKKVADAMLKQGIV